MPDPTDSKLDAPASPACPQCDSSHPSVRLLVQRPCDDEWHNVRGPIPSDDDVSAALGQGWKGQNPGSVLNEQGPPGVFGEDRITANDVRAGDQILWAGRYIEVSAVRIVKFNTRYRSLAFDCLVPEMGQRTLFWRSDEIVQRATNSGDAGAHVATADGSGRL